MTATTATDNDGNPTRLTYAKTGTTWLTFTQTESIHGQVRDTSSPTSEQAYSYDPAARLNRTDDLTGTTCTRRDYAFDANTNRTGLTTTPGTPLASTPGILCDLTSSTPATVSSAYDGADRVTGTGYTYDNLGRTTAAPAAAVTGGAALAVGYSANDMVNTITQAGRTKTYTLDPAGRVLTIADTAGLTLTDHYSEPGDNPAWIGASDGTWTRYTDSPAGGLGLSVDNTGAVQLQLANLHGDIVTTCSPTDTTVPNYTETTEYGLPRDSSAPTSRYGWLGTHHRDTGDALAQLSLMGARLYNPTTGRFLSTDPVAGGSCNDYDYTCADPINGTDLDGRRCFTGYNRDGSCRGSRAYHKVTHYAATHKRVIFAYAAGAACGFISGGLALAACLAGASSISSYLYARNYRQTHRKRTWTGYLGAIYRANRAVYSGYGGGRGARYFAKYRSLRAARRQRRSIEQFRRFQHAFRRAE